MDPTILFIIIAAKPLVEKTVAEIVGDWFLNGVLPSYLADHLPKLNEILKKKTSLDDVLKKTYKKAVKIWCNEEGNDRSALSKRFETHEQLVSLIQQDTIESESITNEIYNIWYRELEQEELGRWFIQENEFKILTTKLDNAIEKLEQTQNAVNEIHENVCSFQTTGQTTFQQNTAYIPRLCYTSGEEFARLAGIQGVSFHDIVLSSEKKHFVLLSSPLMGKTTELKQLCWNFSNSKHYMPILFELKDSGGVLKKDQLPSNDYVDGKAIILVIDAIDEVTEYQFKDQVREIVGYAKLHPNMRIIISCRSNYSHLVDREIFTCVNLGSLTSVDVRSIVSLNKDIHSQEQFLLDIKSSGLSELTNSPFFLNKLMDFYIKKKGLPSNRTEIFDHLIDRSYRNEDDKHISDNISTANEREYLKKVAIVMLLKGQHEISKYDLFNCMGEDTELFNKTLHFGILDYSETKETLSFGYNSIKEYLAASYLADLTLDKIKALVCRGSSEQISSQWYNTICLYVDIVSYRNGGALPEVILNWLSKDNKGLLLHTNKKYVNKELRSQLLIDYIQEQNDSFQPIEEIGTDNMKSIVDFGMGLDLARFLLKELKSIEVVDMRFANLIGAAQFIDWEIINNLDSSLAIELEDELLSFLNRKEFTNQYSWICSQWILNNSCKSRRLLDKLVPIVKESKSQDLINNTLIAIANAGFADEYYDEIKYMQQFVLGNNGLLGRQNVYTVYSQLKYPEHVNDAFSYITDSSFYLYDYSMDEYRKMEKSLLNTAESIYKAGDERIADTVRNSLSKRFNSFYGLRDMNERIAVADDYKRFFINIGKWNSISADIEEIFHIEQKAIDKDAQKRRAEIRKRQYDELMSEATFYDLVHEIINKQDDIDASELSLKCYESLESMNQYAYRFVSRYTKTINGTLFIDKEAVRSALSDRANYLNFMFEENMIIIVDDDPDITISDTYVSQVKEQAMRLLYALCKTDSTQLTNNQMKAIELLLKHWFEVDPEYLFKLIRFSGLPFFSSIGFINDENLCPLFDLICEKSGTDVVKEFVRKELTRNINNVPDYNFRIWASFAIQHRMTETYSEIINRIIASPEDALLIQEQLTTNTELQEKIIEVAENETLKDPQVLVTLLKCIKETTNNFDHRIQTILEKKIDGTDGESIKEYLPILIDYGSIPALRYLENSPDALEKCGVCLFNYNGLDNAEVLIKLFGHYFPKTIIPNPSQSILNNITNIALESKENQQRIESQMKKLAGNNANMKPVVTRWILSLHDLAAAKYYRDEEIQEILGWIS